MSEYGLASNRFLQIRNSAQNAGLRNVVKGDIGPRTPLPSSAGSICIPIDVTLECKRYKADMASKDHVLRPSVPGCEPPTHGVDVEFVKKKTESCKRIRWIQTVHQTNAPRSELSDYIDGGHMPADETGSSFYPWFYDAEEDPVDFADLPCAPYTPGRGKTLILSCAVWTTVGEKERITLIQAFTYGFSIKHGQQALPDLTPPTPRPASTKGDFDNQLKILNNRIAWGSGCETGDDEVEQPQRKHGITKISAKQMATNLVYRLAPTGFGSINAGI
jgi:hypothetical protein